MQLAGRSNFIFFQEKIMNNQQKKKKDVDQQIAPNLASLQYYRGQVEIVFGDKYCFQTSKIVQRLLLPSNCWQFKRSAYSFAPQVKWFPLIRISQLLHRWGELNICNQPHERKGGNMLISLCQLCRENQLYRKNTITTLVRSPFKLTCY